MGDIDYANLYSNLAAKKENVRWRVLRSVIDRSVQQIFGYCGRAPVGPWFGYTSEMLAEAPCNHCGRTNVFTNATSEVHLCPAVYDNVRLPCMTTHECTGKPSMATAPMWRAQDWKEES